MVSFDVRSLFTQVTRAQALDAARRAVELLGEDILPVPKAEFLELVRLCVEFAPFQCLDQYWVQKDGLPMGSPLSATLACLVLECLEVDHYLSIIGQTGTYLRYVDDVIAILPRRCNVDNILAQLNGVCPNIQFTVEKEENDRLPFLDTMLHRVEGRIEYSVYRKACYKHDLIHFFSAHSKRVKQQVVVGFFLRAHRVCSPAFLDAELRLVTEAFVKLRYPRGFVLHCQRRAAEIKARPPPVPAPVPAPDGGGPVPAPDGGGPARVPRLALPNSPLLDQIQRLVGSQVSIVPTCGMKVRDIVAVRRPPHKFPASDVYQIPCGGCNSVYYGETGRSYKTRLGEHRSDVDNERDRNALVQHRTRTNHQPRWIDAGIVHNGLPKHKRKMLESALISQAPRVTNTLTSSHRLASAAAALILRECEVKPV